MRAFLYALSLCALLLSCDNTDPPVRRYDTRGLVKQVSGQPGALSVAIHHERIDGFEDRDGKRSTMDSMQMLFGTASDVPHALFQPGAKLSFAFDVRWSRQPTLLIVKAEELGADAELQLTDGH